MKIKSGIISSKSSFPEGRKSPKASKFRPKPIQKTSGLCPSPNPAVGNPMSSLVNLKIKYIPDKTTLRKLIFKATRINIKKEAMKQGFTSANIDEDILHKHRRLSPGDIG